MRKCIGQGLRKGMRKEYAESHAKASSLLRGDRHTRASLLWTKVQQLHCIVVGCGQRDSIICPFLDPMHDEGQA
jgi:hypothetical protein